MFKHEMGTTVTMRNTRYEGTIVARCEYSEGYVSYLVRSANLSTDGKVVEDWIGEGDLT